MTAQLPTALRRGCAVVAVAAGCLAAAPGAGAKPKVTFSKHVLTVTGGKRSETIVVRCGTDSNVKVNGRNPNGGAVACSRVTEVDVVAGDGDDLVDLSRVGPGFGTARFTGFGTGTGVAVLGGPGDDRLIGGHRALNLLFGGSGRDRLNGGLRRDIVSGGPGADQAKGLGGRDTLLGKGGPDALNGGDGRDLVSGNAGDDSLRGGPGNDTLGGGGGRDRLFGGPGNDRLLGGFGKDQLDGGPGRNVLIQDPPHRTR
jgi:Ca2+-binding RTX toxin-like protein